MTYILVAGAHRCDTRAVSERFVTVDERWARLGRRHRLAPGSQTDDLAALADSLVALHSSDPATVYLSALARMDNPSFDAVSRSLYDERAVVRHHAMRSTLWVVTPDIARVVHASCTAALAAGQWKRLAKMIEDSEVAADGATWVAAAKAEVVATLQRLGSATARQLGKEVPALSAKLHLAVGKPYAGTQGAHSRVLMNLGIDGTLVRGRPAGTWTNSQYNWALMEAAIPGGIGGLTKEATATELVRRYLLAFGPVTTADVQWWTGWTMMQTKASLAAARAVVVDTEEGPAWLHPDDVDVVEFVDGWVALLPALDPTTMGWQQRDWYLGPHREAMFDRNGNAGPAIWVDGRIVGGWAQRRDGEVVWKVFEDIGSEATRAIEQKAGTLQQWLGRVVVTPRFPTPVYRLLRA